VALFSALDSTKQIEKLSNDKLELFAILWVKTQFKITTGIMAIKLLLIQFKPPTTKNNKIPC
jgi:hypothetical protein